MGLEMTKYTVILHLIHRGEGLLQRVTLRRRNSPSAGSSGPY